MSCIWDVEGLVARYHRQALAASEDVKKAVLVYMVPFKAWRIIQQQQ